MAHPTSRSNYSWGLHHFVQFAQVRLKGNTDEWAQQFHSFEFKLWRASLCTCFTAVIIMSVVMERWNNKLALRCCIAFSRHIFLLPVCTISADRWQHFWWWHWSDWSLLLHTTMKIAHDVNNLLFKSFCFSQPTTTLLFSTSYLRGQVA